MPRGMRDNRVWVPFVRTVALASGTAVSGTIVLNWASDADLAGINEVHIHYTDWYQATAANMVNALENIDHHVAISGGTPSIPGFTWHTGQSVMTPPPPFVIPLVFHRQGGNVTFTATNPGVTTQGSTLVLYGEAV